MINYSWRPDSTAATVFSMRRRTGLLFARTVVTLAVAAAVIGAATACAPAKNIGLHPQARPTKVVTTPTPTPLAPPVVRVTQSCSQLVSASALTTAIGVAVPAVTPPGDPDGNTTYTQDGALTCNWSGDAQRTPCRNPTAWSALGLTRRVQRQLGQRPEDPDADRRKKDHDHRW